MNDPNLSADGINDRKSLIVAIIIFLVIAYLLVGCYLASNIEGLSTHWSKLEVVIFILTWPRLFVLAI